MQKYFVLFFLFSNILCGIWGYADWSNDMKAEKWNKEAKDTIDKVLKQTLNRQIAKNIVLFLGDGMGGSTVTCGRIYKGQLKKFNGEEEITNMEKLQHLALAKTYNIDSQTSDSAGTATAYLSGVKTRIGVIGFDGKTEYSNCKSTKDSKIYSIAKWAHDAGKSVGVVTSTRLTHATPAGVYAHTPDREWETFDGFAYKKEMLDEGCEDIATQFINTPYVDLAFGGGRGYFLPNNYTDPATGKKGIRVDGRNLIDEWSKNQKKMNKEHLFIQNATEFRNFDINKYDKVLGLLAYSHLDYEMDKDVNKEPTLVELTEKAIMFLSKNKNGFFLLVEGGKIDHAHHDSKAKKALDEFAKFDDAIGKGIDLVSHDDTLVVVTADHSHTFSLGGYALRGNEITGLVYNSWQNVSDNNVTFTSLLYANGPGGLRQIRVKNLTDKEVSDKEYVQEAAVYLFSETHGGEDVPIYAEGPMSFLFEGTVEQSYIAHAMAYSSCIGPYNNTDCRKGRVNKSNFIESSLILYSLSSFIVFFYIITLI